MGALETKGRCGAGDRSASELGDGMPARPVHVCVQGHGRTLLACPTAGAPAASRSPSVPATHEAGMRDGGSSRSAHAAFRQNGGRSVFPPPRCWRRSSLRSCC